MSQAKKPKLNIERIEDIVADRLAEILIMQLEYEKQKKQDKTNYENKHGKSKLGFIDILEFFLEALRLAFFGWRRKKKLIG